MMATKHQIRCNEVRGRIQRVIAQIPQPRRRGGLTKYGVFAERAFPILQHRGLTKATSSKDITTAVHHFCDGKQNAYGAYLDVYEIVCASFEEEFQSAKTQVAPQTPQDDGEKPTNVIPLLASEKPSEAPSEAHSGPLSEGVHVHTWDGNTGWPVPGYLADAMAFGFNPANAANAKAPEPDNEIEAIAATLRAIDALDAPAKERVLIYVSNRYGLSIG